MEFFAILNQNNAERILKLNIDHSAQERMTDIFNRSYEKFQQYDEHIPFNADEDLTKTECFYIDNFETELDFSLVKNNPEAVTELFIGKNAELKDIIAIITITEEGNILLQNFNKRNIVDLSKTFITNPFTSSNQFKAAKNDGISLDDRLIAILSKENKLYFRSFNTLRHIFDMDRYFKEATNDEINIFVSTATHFEVEDNFPIDNIADTVVRTKITVINKLNILNNYTVEDLKMATTTTTKYKMPLNDAGDKILIPNSKKELKDLLQFLSSNIYSDPITGQTRIAKSSKLYT